MKSNPFSTRFVAPGRIRWIASNADAVERLAAQFSGQLRCRAAIVGKHGTGKSTLVEHLLPHLGRICYRQGADGTCVRQEQTGQDSCQPHGLRGLIIIQLRRSSNPLRQIQHSVSHWQSGRVLILDGFEQLGPLGRAWTLWRTRWRSMGLLVTSHRPVNLPTLCHTHVTPAIAQSILGELLDCSVQNGNHNWLRADVPTEQLLESKLSRHQGNMREVLMELYDEVHPRVPLSNHKTGSGHSVEV